MNEKIEPVQTGTTPHGDDKSKTAAPVNQPTGQPVNPAAPQAAPAPKV